jgi:hypothetical protein
VTRDPTGRAEQPSALLDGELSPELALVDPEIAERARAALPDITLTEIRLGRSLQVGQTPAPSVPQSARGPVAVAEPAPAPARALVRPTDPPAPPDDEIRRVFHEPRLEPRRGRRSTLAALVILGAAAAVALLLPRALDGPSSPTSANRHSSGAPASAVAPDAHQAKAKGTSTAKAKVTSKAKPKAHKRATPRPTRHARPPHKAKRAPTKHAAALPASSRHVSRHKRKAPPVQQRTRALPDFVWVPVKNASGYLVEFRAGSKVALHVRTRGARLHVSTKQLHPGRYRWLVWRVDKSGSPIGKPLVNSNVRVR